MKPNYKLLSALTVAFALIPASRPVANEVDLSASGAASGTIAASIGGTAVFERANSQPTGTGVFQPFLTLDSNGQNSLGDNHLEQGYNTSNSTLPLDDLRQHWNTDLQLGQLATVVKDGKSYYVFELDANETGRGNDNRYLSIDNIRIYTSTTGGANSSDITTLGTLRFALNDPNLTNPGPPPPMPNWVLIDSTQNTPLQKTSGQGSSDMYAYIPVDAFIGLDPNLFIYFYNFNGEHYTADGLDGTSADAGFEEWAALTGAPVPDGGGTLVLLGSALAALGYVARSRKATVKA